MQPPSQAPVSPVTLKELRLVLQCSENTPLHLEDILLCLRRASLWMEGARASLCLSGAEA